MPLFGDLRIWGLLLIAILALIAASVAYKAFSNRNDPIDPAP